MSDRDFKAVIDSRRCDKIREKGWGLSGRPDRIKALNDIGFVWNWGDPERTKRTREELAKYGWAAMWVKKPEFSKDETKI